jgi:hypothetical protein
LATSELPASELIVRSAGSVVRGDRRYLAPTLLRWELGGRLIIGAIPRTTEGDTKVVITANGGVRKHTIAYLVHLVKSGIDELQLLSVGYLPYLTRASYLCAPFRLLKLEAKDNSVTAHYRTTRVRYRGFKIAARELAELVAKNLRTPRVDAQWTAEAADSLPELSRTIVFERDRIAIRDSWSRLTGWPRLNLSTRLLRGSGKAHVAGLDRTGRLLGWSSDGETTFELYSKICTSDALSYEITVTA